MSKSSFFQKNRTSLLQVLALLLMMLLPSIFADTWNYGLIEYSFKGMTSSSAKKELRKQKVSLAKGYAIENNRPLLLIAAGINCQNCDTFEAKVIKNSAFLDYVKRNRIVVLVAQDDSLQGSTKNEYKPSNGGGGTPNIYLFKVKGNEVFDDKAFTESSEVEKPPLYASSFDSSWTVSSFTSLISSKLPNMSLKSVAITGAETIAT